MSHTPDEWWQWILNNCEWTVADQAQGGGDLVVPASCQPPKCWEVPASPEFPPKPWAVLLLARRDVRAGYFYLLFIPIPANPKQTWTSGKDGSRWEKDSLARSVCHHWIHGSVPLWWHSCISLASQLSATFPDKTSKPTAWFLAAEKQH